MHLQLAARSLFFAILLTPAYSARSQSQPSPGEPGGVLTPSPRQLAWQELEFHAFIHFGMNTFTDREWGDGKEDPKLFNPTQLDAKQWVQVFKDAGMKQVVMTCKHHDGFCLWPSKFTTHSVASSPWKDGKGDVVREVRDACRQAGLKFGVYLSPWDRHEPCYGDSPKYNEHFKNQLTELLTTYGPVHEVWFDGACGEGPNGKKQEYDWPGFIEVVRKHAPDAVIFSDSGPDIRWIGNEQGFAGETNWSTLRRAEFYPGTPNHKQLVEGHENGTHWVPGECDVSIRPGWFYHAKEDDKVKSLKDLLEIYYGSVGRNAVLLLNVPPDQRGLIHENDATRLKELRSALDETFAKNLAAGKGVRLTAVRADRPEPDKAGWTHELTDGSVRTAMPLDHRFWPCLVRYEINLGSPVEFDRVLLQEDITRGQLVRAFKVQIADGDDWRTIAEGTTIGYKRLLRVPKTTAAKVRLEVSDARSAPVLSEIALFLASSREPAR
jgi:alpha-L-fucosidase